MIATQELLDELFNRAIDNVDQLDSDELDAILNTMKLITRLDHIYQEDQLLAVLHRNNVIE